MSTGASDSYGAQYHGYTLTHMDALCCHLFYKGKMYNGFSQKEVTEKGAGKLSVINMKNDEKWIVHQSRVDGHTSPQGVKFLKSGTATAWRLGTEW